MGDKPGTPRDEVDAGKEMLGGGNHSEGLGHFSRALADVDLSTAEGRGLRIEACLGLAQCQAGLQRWGESKDSATKALLLSEAAPGDSHADDALSALQARIVAEEQLKNLVGALSDCERLASLTATATSARQTALHAEARQRASALKQLMEAQEGGKAEEVDATFMGCAHYKRRCRMYCPQCNVLSNCRLCHNDSADHTLDRFAVSLIQCGFCKTDQAPSAQCINADCAIQFAEYYCDVCHLWLDRKSEAHVGEYVWHCSDCGMCRIALQGRTKADYAHCGSCAMCWPKGQAGQREGHHCSATDLKANCPCCLDSLHSSTLSVEKLPCGHAIHAVCAQNMRRNYKFACPVCKKTFAREIFVLLRREVALNKMPAEYENTKAHILCNDCLVKSVVPLHFVAMECPQCKGFNTTQVNEEGGGDTEAQGTDAPESESPSPSPSPSPPRD